MDKNDEMMEFSNTDTQTRTVKLVFFKKKTEQNKQTKASTKEEEQQQNASIGTSPGILAGGL